MSRERVELHWRPKWRDSTGKVLGSGANVCLGGRPRDQHTSVPAVWRATTFQGARRCPACERWVAQHPESLLAEEVAEK
jgi:hypothetical protein